MVLVAIHHTSRDFLRQVLVETWRNVRFDFSRNHKLCTARSRVCTTQSQRWSGATRRSHGDEGLDDDGDEDVDEDEGNGEREEEQDHWPKDTVLRLERLEVHLVCRKRRHSSQKGKKTAHEHAHICSPATWPRRFTRRLFAQTARTKNACPKEPHGPRCTH